ncbi:hypothetical protein AN652_07615 [Xanthomonas arboricola pv. pruni]|nr:hypothetical protein DK27_18730 [Xanthomonas arboricola pv. pruni]KPN11112.1 hypothetical protein AN652_07615 [Xanthomonas arboricola pv. pruni]QEX79505.1 hypothetical protein F6Y24_05405 [Xanthomonas arboricola pv. pruni]RST72930.1 hypothetical protein EJK96_03625 [Xanthomonas arboricola pv. pruni]RST78667.1 hypothetical protein EJL05_11750 [Xanthomonas arboricola pv. pruni]
MGNERLKAALNPWMRVGTWHTFHPLDEQRFHRALAAAFEVVGLPADAMEFETAMFALAREHHTDVMLHHLDAIEAYAQLAEDISFYLHNTRP